MIVVEKANAEYNIEEKDIELWIRKGFKIKDTNKLKTFDEEIEEINPQKKQK